MQCDGKTKWRVFLMTMMVVTGACTNPTLKVENMIPSISHGQIRVSDRTLHVKDVTGGTKLPALCCVYTEVKTDNASFQDALVKSVQNAGIFKDVSTSGHSDYELVAEIAVQDNTMVGALTYQTNFLINYYLIDRRTNEEVWSEHIFSQHTEHGSFGDNLQVLLKMNEDAVMKNLSQFITKLSSFLDSIQTTEKTKP